MPGESVTDPVAFTLALAGAATTAGAAIRTGAPAERIERVAGDRLAVHAGGGPPVRAQVVVNAGGLHADAVARLAGDESFRIRPRKGEFLVFDPPGGTPPTRILLPVPSTRTKGVLVFPTLDGRLATGPTAHDQDDKGDWSVRPEAPQEILGKVLARVPELEGAAPVASYAGLRPAGVGCNYVIGPSVACRGLVNVAAIRSTGLTASLGIAEKVAQLAGVLGLELGARAPLRRGPAPPGPGQDGPWWRRTADFESGRGA